MNADELRAYLARIATFAVEALPEHESPDGHFDDPADAAWAREQIAAGNEWGWCVVRVTATVDLPGVDTFTATDYLGACSYESRAAFVEPGGYYDDMKATTINEIAEAIETLARIESAIRRALAPRVRRKGGRYQPIDANGAILSTDTVNHDRTGYATRAGAIEAWRTIIGGAS